MSVALSISIAIASVLAIAAVAKLADLDGSRDALTAFGVPLPLSRPLGLLLPLAELATAALLVAGAAEGGQLLALAGLCALILIALFSAGIAINLARGRTPDCHCFGQRHSAPVSERTLARNGVLLGLAAFVATSGDILSTVLASSIVAGVAGLLHLRSRRAAPAEGIALPAGRPAPEFQLPGLDDSPRSLRGLLQPDRPLLLIFSDPDCGPCTALAPEIAAWQRAHADELTIAVIERRGGQDRGPADAHGRANVLLQEDREIAERYGVDATPGAILIGPGGRVESYPALGPPAIRALVGGVVSDVESELVPGPLPRRELIARVATLVASSGLIAAPAWASRGDLEIKCKYKRCENRCCPKKATCERRGNGKVCICPDGRPACGSRCCPETFVCRRRGRRRRCVCPDGQVVCRGRCVRIQTDPGHCGRCGRACPTGTSCVEGACVGGDGSGTGPGGTGGCECPPGKACCEGQCIDLNLDSGHCGDCGRSCPAGQVCCEGRCRSIQGDHDNCGRCGRRCGSNEVCSGGECRRRCRSGLTNCDGSCVDTTTDADHCGGCSGCTGPFDTGECCNGDCCDYNASACCPGGCRNLALDDENCGACGTVCPPGSFCRFGACSNV